MRLEGFISLLGCLLLIALLMAGTRNAWVHFSRAVPDVPASSP